MSSDTFYVRVASVAGAEVVLDVLTGTGGGYSDLCASRSFALQLLADAARRAVDIVRCGPPGEARDAECRRLYARHEASALHRALEAEGRWYAEAWMRENVGRFVASCEVVARRNALGDEALREREESVAREVGGVLYTNQYGRWQPLRWERCHNYTLRVLATDPRWTEHLEPGLEFGTTAYDAWYEPA